MNNETLSLKSELIYFKEDVLKDIKSTANNITSKFDCQKEEFSKKITQIESKLEALSGKLLSLSNTFSNDKSNSEKIESLDKFRIKAQDTLFTLDIKLKSQSKLIKDTSYRLESFINENIFYNGIIGPTPNCKFSNFHGFIDYILSNINQLNSFKDKTMNLDYKGYKNKIDNSIEMIKLDLENNLNFSNNFTKQSIEECEERIKSMLNLNEEKIMQIRAENNKKFNSLEKNFENINNESKKLIKDLYDNIQIEKEEINNMYKFIDDKIEVYHKECFENYEKIKNTIEGLSEPNEAKETKDRNKNVRHKTVKGSTESFLKKYIEGKVGVDEVSHHKNSTNINLSSNLNENNTNNKTIFTNLSTYNKNINNKKRNPLFSSQPIKLKEYNNNNNNLSNEKNTNINDQLSQANSATKILNIDNYEYKNIKKIIGLNLNKTVFEPKRILSSKNNINSVQSNSNKNNSNLSAIFNYKNEGNKNQNILNLNIKNINDSNNYFLKLRDKKEIKESNILNIKQNEINKKIKESKSEKVLLNGKDSNNEKEKEKDSLNKENSLKNNYYINSLSTDKNTIYNNSTNNNNFNIITKMKNEIMDTNDDNSINYNKINLNQNDINKIIIKSLISGHNSLPKLSLLNNDTSNNDEDYPYSIATVVNIKNLSASKNRKDNKDISNYLNNKTNNNINNKSKFQKISINISNEKENNINHNNNNLLSVLNYSDNNIPEEKTNQDNDLSERKSTKTPNKNIMYSKSDKNGIKMYKEKVEYKNYTNKKSHSKNKSKDKLFLYDSFSNNNKIEIIAKNQIETSLKHMGAFPNNINNKDLFSAQDKAKSNFWPSSSTSNLNIDYFKKNKK